uniref:Uncharacterized protein n=1 Tax=Lygus hesperus TaxID=30085 RepID=A0A0A9WK47_LYGHE
MTNSSACCSTSNTRATINYAHRSSGNSDNTASSSTIPGSKKFQKSAAATRDKKAHKASNDTTSLSLVMPIATPATITAASVMNSSSYTGATAQDELHEEKIDAIVEYL